ncbi:MAG TPA: ribonuclease P protein component [Candidatus Sulfotelmatobacter sp.]|nr:ribonuclease P protein component [Candidatus Sulfotelmatobacter sp.]
MADAPVRASVRANIQAIVTVSVPEESNEGVERRTGKAAFPRSARLLRHADFERVYKQGRRHFSPSMTVFYQERQPVESGESATGFRVGFTVGRALGGAVQRNRMKRRLREAVRLSRPTPGASVDVVINPKKVTLTADFDAILNEVRQAFVVIEKKLSGSRGGASAANKEIGEGRKPEAERR